MTIPERAEKIWIQWYELPKMGPNKFKEYIESELRAAVDEARSVGHIGCRNDALEKAAQVVAEWGLSGPTKDIRENLSRLTEQIRALKTT